MQINTPKKCLLNYFLRIFFAKKKKFVRDETKERKFLRHPHFETKSKKRHLKFFQHFIMKSRIKTKDIKRRE